MLETLDTPEMIGGWGRINVPVGRCDSLDARTAHVKRSVSKGSEGWRSQRLIST